MYSHAHKIEMTASIFAQRWAKKFFVHFSNKAVETISPCPITPAAIPVVVIRIIGRFQPVNILLLIWVFILYFHLQFTGPWKIYGKILLWNKDKFDLTFFNITKFILLYSLLAQNMLSLKNHHNMHKLQFKYLFYESNEEQTIHFCLKM